MSVLRRPSSPSAGPRASEPVAGKTAPCCWCDDYTKEISTESYGRYFRKYKGDGSEYNYSFQRKWKLLAPVKTGGKITVEVRFKAAAQTGVTADDVTAAKGKLEAGVNTHWNGKFTLEADDPECGKKSFPIEYKVVWVDSGEHITIKIHAVFPRENVTGFTMNVAKTTLDWTYAHEFGHCVGLPDEYSYTTDLETVKYIKPTGTLDAAVSAPYNGKSSTDADATIMAAHSCNTTLPRHAWLVAIETQELLTASLGRPVRCTIT